jgi:cyclase
LNGTLVDVLIGLGPALVPRALGGVVAGRGDSIMGRKILRIASRLALVALVAVLAIGTALYWYVGRIGIHPVAERLYMLTGVGGNVGVLVTAEGVVVVDTMTLVRQGRVILTRIGDLTEQPVIAVINTHYHLDHTHGNPAFAPGTRVVATDRTLHHLQTRDAEYWQDSPARDLLPNETFVNEREYRFGSDVIHVIHPGRGHTDGDLVVLFTDQKVLHTGDLLFNGRYPNIDLEAGGTIPGWIETLEEVKALDFETVIPGHGPLTDRAGIDRFQGFLRSLWSQTGEVVRRGGSLEDAQREVDLSEFGLRPIWFAPFLNHDFVVRRAFEETTGTFSR